MKKLGIEIFLQKNISLAPNPCRMLPNAVIQLHYDNKLVNCCPVLTKNFRKKVQILQNEYILSCASN